MNWQFFTHQMVGVTANPNPLLTPTVYSLNSHWVSVSWYFTHAIKCKLFGQKLTVSFHDTSGWQPTWALHLSYWRLPSGRSGTLSYMHVWSFHSPSSICVSVVWLIIRLRCSQHTVLCRDESLFMTATLSCCYATVLFHESVLILKQIYHKASKWIITNSPFTGDHACRLNWISLSQVCWINMTNYTLFRCSDTVCSYADDLPFVCVLICYILFICMCDCITLWTIGGSYITVTFDLFMLA